MPPDDPERGHRRSRGRPRDPYPGLPVDPDVTEAGGPGGGEGVVHLLRRRREVLAVVAVGGALGALARWGLARALPHDPGTFPWSTATANVTGCFALGLLMILAVQRWPDRHLLRPFVGTGLLGGYTTFSTYAVDTRGLLAAGRPAVAAAYLVGTLALGLLAVVAGLRTAERVLR